MIIDPLFTYYDVSVLREKEIEELLQKLNPLKVIFPTYRSLNELLINRICCKLNIQTVYLEHGLYSKDTEILNIASARKCKIQTLKKYWTFSKYYTIFILRSGNILRELNVLYRAFFKNEYNCTKFNSALFFGEYGYRKLNHTFGFEDSEVRFCGYPLFESDEVKNQLQLSNNDDGTVLYVHQPFIKNKQTFISYEEERDYIVSFWSSINYKYDKFTLLLHPREDLLMYQELYKKIDIEIIQSPNDYKLFLNRSLVLGHYSTALLYALYFNRRTVIIDYPGTNIDDVFVDIVPYSRSTAQLVSLVKNGIPYPKANMLSSFIGPNNTYENIAKMIESDM
jgi:hypothetical protein